MRSSAWENPSSVRFRICSQSGAAPAVPNTVLSGAASPSALPDLAPDDGTRSRYTRILLTPAAGDTDEMMSMADDCLNRIRKARLDKRFAEISEEMKTAPADRVPILLAEAQDITERRKKLR